MRICFLAPANSAHIKKWSKYFVSKGYEVHIVSFTNGETPGTTVHFIDAGVDTDSDDGKKLRYLLMAGRVRKIVSQISPDVINVHYATSYGTVAAIAGIKNYILSVWGSDIFVFPNKSPLHKLLLEYSLRKADFLFSTSQAMADEANKYTNKHFYITPFGVDTELFSPTKRTRCDNDFVIGTVKGLSPAYGIDYLVEAVALVHSEHPEIPIKLRIAGKGPDAEKLRVLANNCGIDDITTWLGFISQERVAEEWANMDLAVIYSAGMESFGVSAVEAQACACPVIISDVPGLMEATKPGVTSLVVPRKDAKALAEAIACLYYDKKKRSELGTNGRNFVIDSFEYKRCFERIEALYGTLQRKKRGSALE